MAANQPHQSVNSLRIRPLGIGEQSACIMQQPLSLSPALSFSLRVLNSRWARRRLPAEVLRSIIRYCRTEAAASSAARRIQRRELVRRVPCAVCSAMRPANVILASEYAGRAKVCVPCQKVQLCKLRLELRYQFTRRMKPNRHRC